MHSLMMSFHGGLPVEAAVSVFLGAAVFFGAAAFFAAAGLAAAVGFLAAAARGLVVLSVVVASS